MSKEGETYRTEESGGSMKPKVAEELEVLVQDRATGDLLPGKDYIRAVCLESGKVNGEPWLSDDFDLLPTFEECFPDPRDPLEGLVSPLDLSDARSIGIGGRIYEDALVVLRAA